MGILDEDLIIEQYSDIVVLYIGLPAIIGIPITFKYLDVINDTVVASLVVGGIAIALVAFVWAGVASFRRYKRFPWIRKYFVTLVLSLFIFPAFANVVILGTNGYFDHSVHIRRETIILDKREDHTYTKGRRTDQYHLYVKPWSTDEKSIPIKVNAAEFAGIRAGNRIAVNTRLGFWGIEYQTETE